MPHELATEQPFKTMASQMNKIMDQLTKGYFSFRPGETWTPAVNLSETDSAYLVCVDLAGVAKNKIELEVADGRLTVRGTRPVPTHGKSPRGDRHACKMKVHLMEIDHGQFVRQVELPENVLASKISATYRNGLLWVELPKKKRSRE